MLERAYINDPVLRYGKDSNFFNRAREIEKMNGVPLQQQSGDISRRLQEIEMRGFGDRIKLVPVAPEAELNLDIKPPKADGEEVPPKADGEDAPPKAQFSDAALARIAQSDPKVEIPEIEESPKRKSKLLRDTYGELSPSERAYVANQRYELLKSESGLTPRQALTGEVIAEFEQAIKDADAGVTPRSKELTEKIQAVNEQIVVFGDTQLKDIF